MDNNEGRVQLNGLRILVIIQMESILRNETVRAFLGNFERVDQAHILEDLVVIGIQTVMRNVQENGGREGKEDSLDGSWDQGAREEIEMIRREVKEVTKRIGLGSTLPRTQPHPLKVVKHETQGETGWGRASPRHREVTAKVTESYPEGRTMPPARSQEKFRHHLDDTQIKQAFVEYEPPKTHSRIPKVPTMKPSQDRQQLIENIRSSNHPPKSPPKERKEEFKESVLKESLLSEENPERNRKNKERRVLPKQSMPVRKVESKIKDLIDFDKKNVRHLKPKKESGEQMKEEGRVGSQEVMSFKKIKMGNQGEMKKGSVSRERSSSLNSSSSSHSEGSFSPYKKDRAHPPPPAFSSKRDPNPPHLHIELQKETIRHPKQYSSPSDLRSDSQYQFSRYQTSQHPSHAQQDTNSYSSYSGAGSSCSSRVHSNKPIGKITKKR